MSKVELIHCNQCGTRTRHQSKSDYETSGEEQEVSWEEVFSVLECGGCGTVSFRRRTWFSEWQDYGSDPFYQYEYFPPRLDRPEPRWFSDLPDELQEVLEETYSAYHSKLRYLAAVGVRTALDMAIVLKIGDVGRFDEKVALLNKNNFITEAETELLNVALDAGHAAAHRGFRPPTSDLEVLLDILESVLDALFVKEDRLKGLRRSAEKMGGRVPARSKPSAKQTGEKQLAPGSDGSADG